MVDSIAMPPIIPAVKICRIFIAVKSRKAPKGRLNHVSRVCNCPPCVAQNGEHWTERLQAPKGTPPKEKILHLWAERSLATGCGFSVCVSGCGNMVNLA
ncbi:hypothetical protein CSC3H3_02205 [Thalassospira marina]|uniref:Uncharacterized protein n=1 Tax=Thalassospira marina TaxID=2048283 RepID=A0A2N3KD30_9PROT|nr:hypothetical protein CSC3H3_02205 [Thalassospira marina]PKR48479.1 hypothetical protein COO20_23945 [Thalassospira marina]